MNLTPKKKFVIAVYAQFIVLFFLIAFKIFAVQNKADIFLPLTSLEFSPQHNSYILKYEISEFSQDFFSFLPIKNGEAVYIPLRKERAYFKPVPKISKEKPEKYRYFIKGWVISGGTNSEMECLINSKNCFQKNEKISILYGIEEYSAKNTEIMGEKLEKEFFAKVSIDYNGSAILKKIYKGKRSF